MLPASITTLTEQIQALPGVGRRGAQKLALDLLQLPNQQFINLDEAISRMRNEVKFCHNCGFFAQNSEVQNIICSICSNSGRSKFQICLVEKPTDVLNIEKTQIYSGLYHVLGNLISPLDNVFVENTSLMDLMDRRITELLNTTEKSVELILFFRSGFAAEATTAYLRQVLHDRNLESRVQLTKLAEGLPLYYNPDNLDQATMTKALEDRRGI
jgi:recombination protein RecR